MIREWSALPYYLRLKINVCSHKGLHHVVRWWWQVWLLWEVANLREQICMAMGLEANQHTIFAKCLSWLYGSMVLLRVSVRAKMHLCDETQDARGIQRPANFRLWWANNISQTPLCLNDSKIRVDGQAFEQSGFGISLSGLTLLSFWHQTQSSSVFPSLCLWLMSVK